MINGVVIDFGCGSKPYEELFYNADQYIGLDIEKSGHCHKNSKVDIYYDGSKIPLDDSSVNWIVCFEVFEHIFNVDDILLEMKRVLKADGELLLTIPFAWFEHEAPYDFARYTSFGMKSILERNGFSVTHMKKTTGALEAIFQLILEYFSLSFRCKFKIANAIIQFFIIFPLAFIFNIMIYFFPKRDDLYCNLLIIAKCSS